MKAIIILLALLTQPAFAQSYTDLVHESITQRCRNKETRDEIDAMFNAFTIACHRIKSKDKTPTQIRDDIMKQSMREKRVFQEAAALQIKIGGGIPSPYEYDRAFPPMLQDIKYAEERGWSYDGFSDRYSPKQEN